MWYFDDKVRRYNKIVKGASRRHKVHKTEESKRLLINLATKAREIKIEAREKYWLDHRIN